MMVHDTGDRNWVKAFYDSAAEWWGESWYDGENLPYRLARVEHYVGPAPKNLLELGAGTGETAAFLAAAGYQVTALDISEKNYALLCRIAGKFSGVTAISGDYFTASISGKFDGVLLFENFGMGTDAEQRSLLRRIAAEWLAPNGMVIMDVYHPLGPIQKAGFSHHLNRLENVPGSVPMTERYYFDAVLSRWIDVWEPEDGAGNHHLAETRWQSVRCYTPADLLLLLEGTGLKMAYAEFCGEAFDPQPTQISISSPMHNFEKDYAYTVVLTAES
jgi:SAM-dependent methyltransferase